MQCQRCSLLACSGNAGHPHGGAPPPPVVKTKTKRERVLFPGVQRLALAVSVVVAAVVGALPAAVREPPAGAPPVHMPLVDGQEVPVGTTHPFLSADDVPSWLLKIAKEWCKEMCARHILPGLPEATGWIGGSGHFARNARHWFKKLVTQYDASRPPAPLIQHRARKHNIPDGVLDFCVNIVAWHGYLNKAGAAHDDPFIQLVMKAYDCSVFYLWRRLKEHNPHFQKCLLFEPKMMLSAHVKSLRIAYSHYMKESFEALLCYVWVDQKQVYISKEFKGGSNSKGWRAWGLIHKPGGTRITMPTPWCQDKWDGISVYYYAAVNAILGAVCIHLTSGCKGPGAPVSMYKVSGICA